MSARARRWAKEHAGAGAHSRVEGKGFQILMALAHDADDAGVVDDATVARLGARVHACRRKVQYALRKLETLGIVAREERPGRGCIYRVLQPSVTCALGGALGGAKPQVAKTVEATYRGAQNAPPHIEEASFTDPSSSTTTLEPVPPGGADVGAAGGGGRSLREEPTSPRPVPDAPLVTAPAGDTPDPLEPVLERLSPDAAAALRAIVDLAWDNPDVHPVVALLAATALVRAEAPEASQAQVAAAITRRAFAGARRAERPRRTTAGPSRRATPAPSRTTAPASHPQRARPPGRSAGGRARRDPHVRPAVPPPAPAAAAPAPAAGPIPRVELERIALELAAHHGVPDEVAPEVAAAAAHAAWLKAQQGTCANVLLYADGVVRRGAREARERAARAAAAAAAPPQCPHRNDPATCGQCNYQPAAGIPAQARADLEALKRELGLAGRSPPAEAM